jgi:hypothetical protein
MEDHRKCQAGDDASWAMQCGVKGMSDAFRETQATCDPELNALDPTQDDKSIAHAR